MHTSEFVCEIHFLKKGSIEMRQDAYPPRFSISDKIRNNKMNDKLELSVFTNHTDEVDLSAENAFYGGYCKTCFVEFEKTLDNQLNVFSFDVLKEWSINIPLPLRIMLESVFLKSGISEEVNSSRVSSLFCLTEALFNIKNKHYHGITQDMNTDELLIHYHNVSSVFEVTSHVGLTQSQRTGDRRLKHNADPELCYYQTYLRSYPLSYRTIQDRVEQKHHVSLRQCHLAFLMDNLVHLTTNTDPLPGESRTNQICTLQLTLKGIPKDSSLVEQWHGEECDGTEDCLCKNQDRLTKADASKVFWELSVPEEKIYKTFREESMWMIGHLWQQMNIENFLHSDHVPEVKESVENTTEKEINELDKTFESLTLNTSNEMSEELITTDEQNLDKSMELLNLSSEEYLLAHISEKDDDSDRESSIPEMPSPNLSIIDSDSDTIDLEEYEGTTCELLIHEFDDEEETQNCNEKDTFELQLEEDTSNIREIEMLFEAVNEETCSTALQSESNLLQKSNRSNLSESTQSLQTSTLSVTVENCHFTTFSAYPILTRHPPPASGRDDDINVLKNVLDDILLKLDHTNTKERIMFAPDFKIANNLFKLIDSNPKYKAFLPEFPVIHLRKSKITNLITAYKDSGLIHLLQYMKDEENEKEWTKLLTIANIEIATRNIWRLSTAIYVALALAFFKTLPENELEALKKLMSEGTFSQHQIHDKFGHQFEEFVKTSCEENATFCLHFEIMTHCDEIIAIDVSERIGGPGGHNLLLASVKSSLPFSFLNGASSYAGFCARLLIEHYQTGLFHKNFKQSFYTLPYNNTNVNFGLDTLREIDHRSAKKCIRPGSTLETVLPKMSTVDKQNHLHNVRKYILLGKPVGDDEMYKDDNKAVKSSASKYLGRKLSQADIEHISMTIKLMLRQNAFNSEKDPVPRNIYHSKRPEISTVILDKNTYDIGKYLIKRFACGRNYLNLTQDDIPSTETLHGPKELINRIKRNQSVTIKRTTCKPKDKPKSEKDKEEKKPPAKVKKLSKVIDCMSSSKNTCKAVLKPDGSKNVTNKSLGVKKALVNLIKRCIQSNAQADSNSKSINSEINNLLLTDFTTLPKTIQESGVISIVEFAGTKFKVFASSGQQYLDFISNQIIKKLLNLLTNIEPIIICEEKYQFTPDDFKANTRAKRQHKEKISISHLKEEYEIVSSEHFNKPAVVGTMTGKKLISRYLATQIEKLKVKANLEVIVDSEANMSECECQKEHEEACARYTIPLRVLFDRENGFVKEDLIRNVKQRKGEAEMAQVDWLLDKSVLDRINNGTCVVNYVTSADIDTVVIHLLAVSQHWPRNHDYTFKCSVYLILQKKKPELYNITGMLTLFEESYGNRNVGVTIACVLSMGGNDYLPNFHSISHDTLLTEVMNDPNLQENLVTVKTTSTSTSKTISLSNELYISLYCPSNYDNESLSFEEIRQVSIKPPDKEFRHPQKWMPPKSALEKLVILVQCQLDYFETIGLHEAYLPNYLSKGCLFELDNGRIQIDLGKEAFVQDRKSLLTIDESTLNDKLKSCTKGGKDKKATKRRLLETPQKGKSGKRIQNQSTPRKLANTDVDEEKC